MSREARRIGNPAPPPSGPYGGYGNAPVGDGLPDVPCRDGVQRVVEDAGPYGGRDAGAQRASWIPAADGEAARPDEHRGVTGIPPRQRFFPLFLWLHKERGPPEACPGLGAHKKERIATSPVLRHLLQVLGDEGALELVYAVQASQ